MENIIWFSELVKILEGIMLTIVTSISIFFGIKYKKLKPYFTSKRHEIYAQLYQKISLAHESCKNLFFLPNAQSFDDLQREDIDRYMSRCNVKGYRDYILSSWSKDPKKFRKKFKDFYTTNCQYVKNIIADANSYFSLNALFLSEEVENEMPELFELMNRRNLFAEIKYYEGYTDKQLTEDNKDEEKIQNIINDLKNLCDQG